MAHVTKHPTAPKYRMKVGAMPDFSGANEVRQEEPIGARDGVNKIFVIAKNITKGTERVYRDGMYIRKGEAYDYTMIDKQITFSEPPPVGSTILVDYKFMEPIV